MAAMTLDDLPHSQREVVERSGDPSRLLRAAGPREELPHLVAIGLQDGRVWHRMPLGRGNRTQALLQGSQLVLFFSTVGRHRPLQAGRVQQLRVVGQGAVGAVVAAHSRGELRSYQRLVGFTQFLLLFFIKQLDPRVGGNTRVGRKLLPIARQTLHHAKGVKLFVVR